MKRFLGLKEIHKIKSLHRDLIPDNINIFIDNNNKIKICDFNISKKLTTSIILQRHN